MKELSTINIMMRKNAVKSNDNDKHCFKYLCHKDSEISIPIKIKRIN